MEENRLFAVLLGGNPPGTGVEVHDVVFTVGPTLEATREQMLAAWFAGGPAPHVDSWMELDVVDGARIALCPAPVTAPASGGRDLWHVYLGYYESGSAGFMEGHESVFVIAADAADAKARAKRAARRAALAEHVHTDAMCRVSDRLADLGLPYCVVVVEADGTGGEDRPPEKQGTTAAHDGYRPFPEGFLSAHWRRG